MNEPAEAPATASWRTDRHIILRKPRSNGAGGLILDAFISKPGVLVYSYADGKEVRELVTADVLHETLSLDSVRMAPVTVDHPSGEGTITAQNFDRLAVGMVGERVDIAEDGSIRMTLNVASERGVKAIEGRLDGTERRREVSAGYFVTLDETSGEHPKHGRYDRIQKERVYNHIALVHSGRAGSSVRVRADEAHRTLDEDAFGRGDAMNLEQQLAAAQTELADLQKRFDSMEAEKIADFESDVENLRTRLDGLVETVTEASAEPTEEERAAAAEERRLDRGFRRRLDGLLSDAKLDVDEADGLDTDDLVEAVFKGLDLKEIKLDGVNEISCRRLAVNFRLDVKPSAHPYEPPSVPRKSPRTDANDARLTALLDVHVPHPDKTAEA